MAKEYHEIQVRDLGKQEWEILTASKEGAWGKIDQRANPVIRMDADATEVAGVVGKNIVLSLSKFSSSHLSAKGFTCMTLEDLKRAVKA